jgi:hypothetical protein
MSSTSQRVTISPIPARAKDEPHTRLGISTGKIVGSIVSAPIPRVIMIVMIITLRGAVARVVIIARPVIVVVAVVIVSRPVVPIPPALAFVDMPSVVIVIRAWGVVVATAGPGESGSEQDRNGKNYEKLH